MKIKEDAVVRDEAIYFALDVLPEVTRDLVGPPIEGSEGAKFGMRMFSDLKTRGLNLHPLAVTNRLKGMPEALEAVYRPLCCIVHLTCNSLDYASMKDQQAAGRFDPAGCFTANASTRSYFPSEAAASKLIWLARRNSMADWQRAAKDRKEAMTTAACWTREPLFPSGYVQGQA